MTIDTAKKINRNKRRSPKATLVDSPLYYVGIGASAGGLEALRPFVANLPESANMTYIVAQHMSPDHRSMMVELLDRSTNLNVLPAKNNLLPLANTIYVAPANTDVTISDGKLRLSNPSNTIGPKPSINRLFISLADDREENSIGIILSGTGSDGAHGIKAIKAAGGIAIAQDPRSAKYDSMPVAAIRIGGADLVLPSSEAASQLKSLTNRPRVTISNDQDELPPSTIRGIIHQIATHTGMDFTSYKEATLSRQIMRRMMAKQISGIEEYGIYLSKNVQELRELANNFLICVTSFFRDPEAFDALRNELKNIIEKKRPGDDIRIWIPACATGEEVYSIAIFLMEDFGEQLIGFRFQIFATDINSDAIQTARAGVYPETALTDVKNELIEKYFSVQNGMYIVDKRLKEVVLFARQDLTQDPPFVRLDMVCCRNLLIYFKPELQEKVIKIFHYSLRQKGILFLGKSETIGKSTNLFSEADRKNKIYRKRDATTTIVGSFGRIRSPLKVFEANYKPQENVPDPSPHASGIEQLFGIYAPPSVLINQDGEILEIFGDCSSFLSIRKGKANFNLFALINQTFRSELRAFVHRVAKNQKSAYSMPEKISIEGKEEIYRLAVHYASDQNMMGSDLLIVSFEKVTESPFKVGSNAAMTTDEESAKRMLDMEQELLLNRENLQTVIEELETANEELQSLNEEAQAGNEELQASNEELETANEELQASNEELTTVNDELSARTVELSKTNADMDNVLSSLYKALLVIDTSLTITRFNDKALDFFDIPSGLPANLTLLKSKYRMDDLLKYVHQVITSGEHVEYEFEDDQGKQFFQMRLSPYIDKLKSLNAVEGVVVSIADISDKKETEQKLRLSASVFDHAAEATMITDARNHILAVNPAFTKITGYGECDVIGHTPKILSSGRQSKDFYRDMWDSILTKGSWTGEIENRRKSGEIYSESVSINVLRDAKGQIIRHIAVFTDVTESKKALELIEHQANYDSLTGLPNRSLIQDRIEQQLIYSRRSGALFAIMFLDLDDFKSINDSLGHSIGDMLIVKAGERLHKLLREEDTVGRLGGDEFIILVNNFNSINDVIGVANKILKEMRRAIKVADHTIHTAVSIGITIYPSDGDSTDSLMRNADTAMYESKKKGRNTYSFFTHEMQDIANQRQWIMGELAMAVHEKQLELYFQPIIDLKSMKVVGAEALLRWNHPQQGMIPPDKFIPVAENSGMIIHLSEWVLSIGLEKAKFFSDRFGKDFHTAINMSMAQFVSSAHTNWLIRQLGISESKITIELTESLKLVDNQEYRSVLNLIKKSGCDLALDDFGTGQSSLSYIKQVPVDIVKIDKSFVRDIATDPMDAAFILAILQMAKAFNLLTVAEGVETLEQLVFLKENGCHLAQGFLFKKALPYEEFIDFVDNFDGEQWVSP